jgi:hypothetical protein
MNKTTASTSAAQLILYWLIVGTPLAWGVWKTLVKLPALFQ